MKFLRQALTALAISGALLSAACEQDAGPDTTSQNTTEISENLMEAQPSAPGGFDVSRRSTGQWFFATLGEQGQMVLSSQDYVEKVSALNGILSVEENGVHAEQYVVTELDNGLFSFVLRAKNNQVIADGQLFRTLEGAEAGIESARELVAGIVQHKAAVTNGARFDLWREDSDHEWYFVMRAEDGRILLESEGYTGRTGAVNGIESVRTNGKDLGRYQMVSDDGGAVYFILKAANGQEIAQSGETFGSEAEVEAAIVETAELLDSERVANPW
ncbi:MAG: YegP family protein [Myxococcales bacterium]|nr:YegP family protein [Myxococcales bacterium]